MFTGLIETVGVVRSARRAGDSMELAVWADAPGFGAVIGDSISVNGACLTAVKIEGALTYFDASPETVERTTVAEFTVGHKVNLERAMAAGGRFGGHFVLGHVDGIARLKKAVRKGRFYDLTFEAGHDLLNEMVFKGSVAVDGISLTIASIDGSDFRVAVIPVTWDKTNLHTLKPGDAVNIETDIIVKSIRNQLLNILGRTPKSMGGSLTMEQLLGMGH